MSAQQVYRHGTCLLSCCARMEDIIENLKGHSYYFVADLKSGCDAVPLKDESRDLTAFHTYDLGLMRLTSLPQGYTNAMIEFC